MLVKRYGLDPLRYYLMRSLPVDSDGTLRQKIMLVVSTMNLPMTSVTSSNRTVAMINKYFEGKFQFMWKRRTSMLIGSGSCWYLAQYHKQMNANGLSTRPWKQFEYYFSYQ